jgi:ankyrin repeat protein
LIRYQTEDGEPKSSREYYSILKKGLDSIRLLIEYGVNINNFGEDGYTSLDYSVMYNHNYAKKVILDNLGLHSKRFIDYFDIENSNYNKVLNTTFVDKRLPPIHRDIKQKLKLYKETGREISTNSICEKSLYLDINERDWNGRTPLDLSIEIGNNIAENFLKNIGAKKSYELDEININNTKYELARKYCILSNLFELKKIENIHLIVNNIYPDKFFETLLHELLKKEFIPKENYYLLEFLLTKGANPNIYVKIPLLKLIVFRYLNENKAVLENTLRLLLKNNLDINQKDNEGKTAISYIIGNKSYDNLFYILKEFNLYW